MRRLRTQIQGQEKAEADSKAARRGLEAELTQLRCHLKAVKEAEAVRQTTLEAKLQDEVEALRSKVEALRTKQQESEEASRRTEAERVALLQAEIETLRSKAQGNEKAAAESSEAERIAGLQAEVASLQEKLKVNDELKGKLEVEIAAMQEDSPAVVTSPTTQVPTGDDADNLDHGTPREAELEAEVCGLRGRLEEAERSGAREAELKAELQAEVAALERALRCSTDREAAELEELAAALTSRDERIEELQEALRESVRITAHEESRRKHIMETVAKLEQRLLSLQTAYAIRCPTCRPLLQRVQDLERQAAEWRRHLADLSHMK